MELVVCHADDRNVGELRELAKEAVAVPVTLDRVLEDPNADATCVPAHDVGRVDEHLAALCLALQTKRFGLQELRVPAQLGRGGLERLPCSERRVVEHHHERLALENARVFIAVPVSLHLDREVEHCLELVDAPVLRAEQVAALEGNSHRSSPTCPSSGP